MVPNHIILHDIMQRGVDVVDMPISCLISAGVSPSFCVDMIKQPDGSTWVVKLHPGEQDTYQERSLIDDLNAAINHPAYCGDSYDAA